MENKIVLIGNINIGVFFSLHINEDQMEDMLNSMFSMMILENELVELEGKKNINIYIYSINKTYYRMEYNNYNRILTRPLVIYNVLEIVSEVFSYFMQEFLCLHGAAIAYKNKASLFIAPTKNGKTTISLNCVLSSIEIEYLTDDLIIINNDSSLLPYPTPIKVRDMSIIDIPDNREISVYGDIVYQINSCNILDKKYEVKNIFFLNREQKLDFHKIDSFEGLQNVIKNTVQTGYNFSKSLAMLRNNINFYQVNYNDYKDIINIIINCIKRLY